MEHLFDDLEDFGSFDDAVSGDVRDPYPELARLRREEPIQRIDMSAMPGEEGKPVFIVYRYEDAQQMLRDNLTFSSSGVIAAFGPVLGERVMLGMDEPVHGRLRSLVSKAFSQKALARLQDELVGRVGNELIDKFAANGKADLVKEFTFDYPSRIIAGLLGLPEEDYPQFQRWSISLLSWIMNPERGLAASAALCEYFAPILEARRAEPTDDMISLLAEAEIDGEKLTDEEIFSFLRLLLPAGVETTYRSLGNLLFALLSDPTQLEAVRADRSLLPQAIEEAVRWNPPLLTITRTTTCDTELGGVPIPEGCSVLPMLGSTNRQEDRWDDPDEFDIFRTAKGNLGWGHGVHVCLGMHLARLEMRTAINLLLDRLPNLRLDPDGDDPHIRGQVFRSPTSLPVLFDPAEATVTELDETTGNGRMADFEAVDYFFDQSLVPDPYPYYDYLRSQCPVRPATPHGVVAVTGHAEALAAYKDPAFSSCVAVAGPFPPLPFTPGGRRHQRADRRAPGRDPDGRARRHDGLVRPREDPRAAEQAHHAEAVERERRVHVAAGRSPTRHVHRQGFVRVHGGLRQALRDAGHRRPARRSARGPRRVPQRAGQRGRRRHRRERHRRAQSAGVAGRQVPGVHQRPAPRTARRRADRTRRRDLPRWRGARGGGGRQAGRRSCSPRAWRRRPNCSAPACG